MFGYSHIVWYRALCPHTGVLCTTIHSWYYNSEAAQDTYQRLLDAGFDAWVEEV